MTHTHVLIVIGLALAMPAADGAAQRVPASDTARIARVAGGLRSGIQIAGRPARTWSLPDRMAHYKAPGVSIAVISEGRIAWARGFGVKETGGGDSVTATTLFQAASISKPVTATATLRLVADRKLDLDTNVNRYLKSWQVPENRFTTTEKVTLRRLLSHSAGLTVHGFPGYAEGVAVPTVVQVLNGERPANTAAVRVDTTPGAIWRYAGGGTTVQQLILTELTGERFPALMKRLVLDPAGMTRSTYEQPLPEALRSDAARAHLTSGTMIAGRWHAYPEMAAAGLWTTPTDLSRWALAIAAARSGTGGLLPQQIASEMVTVQKGSYGLGPSVEGVGRAFSFGHGGANAGFRSQLLYYPEMGVGAAVMVNSDNGNELIQEILYAISAEYGWPGRTPRQIEVISADQRTLEQVAGSYRMETPPGGRNFSITVKALSGVLTAQASFETVAEELVPVAAGAFVGLTRGWRFEFRGDSIVLLPGPGARLVGKR